jgi:hypothetical protein
MVHMHKRLAARDRIAAGAAAARLAREPQA